jgi:glycerol-3-phosphate dehydrogenase
VQGRAYELAVIGGGLTGTAIARDASGRGLSVFLCEQGDLGAGGSSATLKLIHGAVGLIEGMHLGKMRAAMVEREIAMRAAPHLVRPLRFVIPHHQRLWPQAAFSLRLFAFDRVARSSLPRSGRIAIDGDGANASLQQHFEFGFAYSDCVADDARLVILNALDARAHGAHIFPRLRCTVAERDGGEWRLSLESGSGEQSVVTAKMLVNATGGEAVDVHNHVVHSSSPLSARFRKSASIVVRRDATDGVGYALPNADGHIAFAFPWVAGTMVIGAVERDVAAREARPEVDRRDMAYLIDLARQYFHAPVWPEDIVWSFAHIRTGAMDQGKSLVVDAPPRAAPFITVLGGSLTEHREQAEAVVDMLGRDRQMGGAWTAGGALPGGGFPATGEADLMRALRAAYPFLSEPHAARLVRSYGTRASMILTGARTAADLGHRFGSDLTEAECRYLRNEEWAMTAEDILWRRTKLGLAFQHSESAALADWIGSQPALLPQSV